MKVLFVTYGGGHVEMCLPVIRALRSLVPGCQIVIMALTTAFSVAQKFGESPIGFRNFVDGPDQRRALAYGQQLLDRQSNSQVAEAESIAYLGYNFLEWVKMEGEVNAWNRWRAQGRAGFLPYHFLTRVLREVTPDVVVTTNSPRSEEAAVAAASALSIPSLSMVDLFALPGDRFLQRAIHADCITVPSLKTRTNLVAAGVDEHRVIITGNPAMDSLNMPFVKEIGAKWRATKGWPLDARVVLWAGSKESADAIPAVWANSGLGDAIQRMLVSWVQSDENAYLVVRYHPNEWHEFVPPPVHGRIHWSRPDNENLLPVLIGSDLVVVQGSTVGIQASVAGKKVICIGFSPFVKNSGMDYGKLGIGQTVVSFEALAAALRRPDQTNNANGGFVPGPAAPKIARLIRDLTSSAIISGL